MRRPCSSLPFYASSSSRNARPSPRVTSSRGLAQYAVISCARSSPARPWSHTPSAAASAAPMPWHRSDAIKPVSTSPLPPFESAEQPLVLTSIRPSGSAMRVRCPLSTKIQPCSQAKRLCPFARRDLPERPVRQARKFAVVRRQNRHASAADVQLFRAALQGVQAVGVQHQRLFHLPQKRVDELLCLFSAAKAGTER